MPAASLRTLLTGVIDYAGLFPPAALPLSDVHRNFQSYRRSPEAWALGRIVVPAARLGELSALAATSADGPLPVSALIGDDLVADIASIHQANEHGRLVVDTVEASAPTAAAIGAIANALRQPFTVYLEIPADDDPRSLLEAIQRVGARAKIRTGGVVPSAVPSAADCARFITRCAEYDVAFKATAGLHHPLRGDYRFTDAADAPRGAMFGFLNLFVAAALARAGLRDESVAQVLDEREPAAFRLTDGTIAWREHSVTEREVAAARASFAMSFGSCSFREPLDDLQQLGLL